MVVAARACLLLALVQRQVLVLRHQVQVLMPQDACGDGATAELARS